MTGKITKEIYLNEAMKYMPRLLHLLDTNEFHKTYGCFDREFWHYRRTDFPCGMNQEYVLALTLLYKNRFPHNPFYNNIRIRELILGSLDFTRRSSHRDGSCDSFYPYEHALGAVAFSLYACTEAYILMGQKDQGLEDFFKKRAQWLITHDEKGILANHYAIAATSLLNVFFITQEDRYLSASEERLRKVLSVQNREGWFMEYEGCDPGYLTVTIDFLAKYYKKRKTVWLIKPLLEAIQFCQFFVHPDGSYGGEYGSRGTCIFLPHGFEILRSEFMEANQVADKNIMGLQEGRAAIFDDDRIFCHLMYNYIQSYLEPNYDAENTVKGNPGVDFIKYFKEAGLYVRLLKPYYLVLGLGKGGTARLYKNKELIYSDTGFIGELASGIKVSSQVLDRKREVSIDENKVSVRGSFYIFSHSLLSPFKNVVFRLFLITFGRLPGTRDFIRGILQRRLILFKKKVPISFNRCFELDKDGLKVTDTIAYDKDKRPLVRLKIASDHTCTNSAMANVYQGASLLPWIDITSRLKILNKEGRVIEERRIS